MVIKRKELVERNTVDRVALAPYPTGMPLIQLQSFPAMTFQDMNLEGTAWFFRGIFDQNLKDDGQLTLLIR